MSSIAVVGMACRFPGAKNPSDYWRNLEQGVESVSFFSDAELLGAGVEAGLLQHPQYVRAAAVLDDIELFDAGFFRVSPREAEILDVQHRLFLETAWQALEDACCMPERCAGSIGVYAGAGVNSYLIANLLPSRALLDEVGEFQALLSNDKDYLSTRVSYKLNLRGPSISVQSACSTSLVAIHLACQALAHGECDVALAGGVSLRVPQKAGYLYRDGMILSPDGHCRAFDEHAAGTVAGSGVGIVVLKRLEDALADRDLIHAVVLGSAINNDGALKVGYTAPSVVGQRAVIQEALAVADLSAAAIGFVEAHGTGTPLGDPVEFAALSQAFRPSGVKAGHCAIGSVKTNIGHLDAAAGVAGFMKAVLAVQHGRIPPTLHFTRPNPEVPLAGSPFRINTTVEDWQAGGDRRRAGVSSFGIGGTNAHVIIEQGPAVPAAAAARQSRLIVLSARSAEALEELQAGVSRTVEDDSTADLDDVAASLMLGRRSFDHRVAIVAGTREQARGVVRAAGRVAPATPPRLVFMFPGQGSQYPGMGADVYRLEPTFRDTVDRCCARLASALGVDLRSVMFGDADPTLMQTRFAQPAIFVVEYAMAQQLVAWGIHPSAMIGHSVGEFAAACVGGAIDVDEALLLVAERGRLMQRMPSGRMMAVRLAEDEIRHELVADLAIAAVNAPEWSVVSGPAHAVAEFGRRMLARNVECQHLQTSHAFHSAMVDPVLDEFARAVARVPLRPPSIPWISNVTGTWITAGEAVDPAYWTRHLRAPVLFSRGLQALLDVPSLLVEVGPGRALSTLARAHQNVAVDRVVPTMAHARDRSPDPETLLRAVGQLWSNGVPVEWSALSANTGRRRVSLPTTPFERQRYWVEPPGPFNGPPKGGRHVPESQSPVAPALPYVVSGFSRTSGELVAVASGLPGLSPGEGSRTPDALQFSVPVWTPVPLTAVAPSVGDRWLFFVRDEDAVANAIIERISAGAKTLVRVAAGHEYRCESEHRFTIRPGLREDYDALLSALKANGASPNHVVHAWCTNEDHGRIADGHPPDESLFSLLWLAQALGKDDDAEEVRIDVLSSRMQAVGGEANLGPRQALLLGPVRVIPREYPAIRCRSVDYDASRVTTRLIDLLIQEIGAPAPDVAVAYRNHQRYLPRLEPQPLASVDNRSVLRRNGHYLITGGLGGVGLVIAEHLATACAARLTLIGRAELPPRDQWETWLPAHAADESITRKIEGLRRLERAGGQVCLLAADVGDADRLAQAVSDAERLVGPIDGVVHAAGVPAGGMMLRKTRAEVDAVLSPKVDGALNLSRIFESSSLDFMLFMSSVTAFTGEVGQVDYCAANAFLDALAQRLRADGRNVCSVNWDTWREVGMAATTRLPGGLQALRDERLKRGIGNVEGADAFDRVLLSHLAQVAVCRRDLRDLTTFNAETAEIAEPAAEAGSSQDPAVSASDRLVDQTQSAARHSRPALAVAFRAARSTDEQSLSDMWEGLLGISGIGVDDDFFELGGHSLLATQLISRIRDRMSVRLSLASFFDHCTIASLAGLIEAKQVEAVLASVEDLSEDEARKLLDEG